MTDAIVIGAGPNGLVAANRLADAGWEVLVVEAQPEPGGAVLSAEITAPVFVSDVFSSFYPFAAASPVMQALDLEAHGLRWRHAPVVIAHPLTDGRCAVLSRDVEETAASLDAFPPGDGEAYRYFLREFGRVGPPMVSALLGSFPPVRPTLRLLRQIGRRDLLRFAQFATLPARRMGEEMFAGEGARLLLAGNAMHSDVSPETILSGLLGWLLVGLGATVGYPIAEGGASNLTAALVHRLEARGGTVRCGLPVERVLTSGGRAVGVAIRDGEQLRCSKAVIADVAAPSLYLDLLDANDVPPVVRADMERYEWDAATVKVDWALRRPIPWSAPEARRAGTVHLADSVDDMSRASTACATGDVPEHPLIVLGQYAAADATRQPKGAETAWAYLHLPRWGSNRAARTEQVVADMVEHIEARIEALAPGFRNEVLARHVMGPADLERLDANLVGGAINGGTAQLHRQLVFRPSPSSPGPRTPVAGLYLGSASAHPGGGVHGAPGANAAGAALRGARLDPFRRTMAAITKPS